MAVGKIAESPATGARQPPGIWTKQREQIRSKFQSEKPRPVSRARSREAGPAHADQARPEACCPLSLNPASRARAKRLTLNAPVLLNPSWFPSGELTGRSGAPWPLRGGRAEPAPAPGLQLHPLLATLPLVSGGTGAPVSSSRPASHPLSPPPHPRLPLHTEHSQSP